MKTLALIALFLMGTLPASDWSAMSTEEHNTYIFFLASETHASDNCSLERKGLRVTYGEEDGNIYFFGDCVYPDVKC